MSDDGRVPVDYAGQMAEQWLSTACSVAKWYLGLFDPRPDLSMPARSVKFPYTWWW